MGIIHTIDYSVVKDWCEEYDENSIEIFMLLKSMASVMNEKR